MSDFFEHTFQVTPQMVEAFAEITGDSNSLHTNPEIARRYRYRRPVVHGMLVVSFLALIQRRFGGASIEFRRIAGRFIRPVYPNDNLRMRVDWQRNEDGDWTFAARWYRGEEAEIVTDCKGEFFSCKAIPCAPSDSADSASSQPWVAPVAENQWSITRLDGAQETLTFFIEPSGLLTYGQAIFGDREESLVTEPPSPALAATLLLSTLVGMKLPGRGATFVSFELDFVRPVRLAEKCYISATVTAVSAASETLKASLMLRDGEGHLARGKVEVIVNPSPQPMLTCPEIVANHLGLGLEGKVAMVTGASRGIGETISKLLAMFRVRVAVCYFKGRNDAETVVADIQRAGGEALAVCCDVRDREMVVSSVQEVLQRFGKIDFLINTAVGGFTSRQIDVLEWDDIQDELDVSLKGLHTMCRAVIPGMKAAGGGKIVNFSTVALHAPVSGQVMYMSAKGAVEAYTKGLAVDLCRSNIQANLVVPNMTETDLVAGIPASYRRKIAEQRRAGRHVKPIEVAQAVVYLVSSWSDAMTGQKIVLNLGEHPFA